MNKEEIEKIKNVLIRQIDRLDDNGLMKKEGLIEISRSNAISNNALTYLKTVNLELRILEAKSKKIKFGTGNE